MRTNILETFIGIIVIILAISFLFYSFTITGNNTEGFYKVNATFNRIDGLQIGSDVRLSGIKIGNVASSSLNQVTYEANLTLNIDNSINIGKSGMFAPWVGTIISPNDKIILILYQFSQQDV